MERFVRANLANFITASRIVLAPLAWIFADNAWLFAALWLLCGLTDATDGLIARALDAESDFGARLDSIADIVMFGVIALLLLDSLATSPMLLRAVAVIAALRVGNLVIAAVRFRHFASIHTWANKAAGLLLFVAPLGFALLAGLAWAWAIVLVALAAALEEMAILLRARALNLNARWIGDLAADAHAHE